MKLRASGEQQLGQYLAVQQILRPPNKLPWVNCFSDPSQELNFSLKNQIVNILTLQPNNLYFRASSQRVWLCSNKTLLKQVAR